MAKKTKEKETSVDKHLKSYVKSYTPLIIVLIALVVIFFILYYIFQGIGTVKYQGLTFTKEKFGDILVYSYNYFVKTADDKIAQRTLYLRNDPRYNDVPVNGKIIYPAEKRVYISINGTGLTECEDNLISIASLSSFIVNNNLLIKAGLADENEAKINNQTHITCKDFTENVVITLKSANETRIEKTINYCYDVEIANCEILKAVEKFIVQSLIDARNTS